MCAHANNRKTANIGITTDLKMLARLTKSSVMTLHSRMFYVTSTATIRQLLEILLMEIKVRMG
jgi:hypothetical protein